METKQKNAAYVPPQMEVMEVLVESLICVSGGIIVSDPWADDSEEEW